MSDTSILSVQQIVDETPVWDFHTHLYPPTFGTPVGKGVSHDPQGLMLWGLDELLTYHYLVAELFRVVPPGEPTIDQFWAMSKTEQADLIWKHLFLDRSPISEACRGVLTSLQVLGLDPNERSLAGHRKWFAEQDPSEQIDRVMELAGVSQITMTNAVFDDNERNRWLADPSIGDDPRFDGVLRFDPLLMDWPAAAKKLSEWGYSVSEDFSGETVAEASRFVGEWIDRVRARYCAVSLPPSFRFPYEGDDPIAKAGQRALTEVVLPVCEERGLPLATMIGSVRGTNPVLGDAGDTLALADVASVGNLCLAFPNQRFYCTVLARENQHELAVTARKFGNLTIFGCWWFLNNPSLIDEITRMRVELLGTSFIPQHSDARVLEQLLYKWTHSREVIGNVLEEKFTDLAATGWEVSEADIRRDAKLLLHGNPQVDPPLELLIAKR